MSTFTQWLARQTGASYARTTSWAIIIAVLAALGYVDLVTGSRVSLLVFYLFPVALAVLWLGLPEAFLVAVGCVATWFLANKATGAVYIDWSEVWWNSCVILSMFLVVAVTLHALVTLTRELEQRVHLRTEALEREILGRKRLERDLIDVTIRERNAISQDLHDGLCQHLTATGFAAQLLHDRLVNRHDAGATEAETIVRLLESAVAQTRSIARGHLLPIIDPERLVGALNTLATNTTQHSRVACHCSIWGDPQVGDQTVASHIFCIAQEAVRNAVRHAAASRIEISLVDDGYGLELSVTDDGCGVDTLRRDTGLGLKIMMHRAELVGGELAVRTAEGNGTCISCRLPLLPREAESA